MPRIVVDSTARAHSAPTVRLLRFLAAYRSPSPFRSNPDGGTPLHRLGGAAGTEAARVDHGCSLWDIRLQRWQHGDKLSESAMPGFRSGASLTVAVATVPPEFYCSGGRGGSASVARDAVVGCDHHLAHTQVAPSPDFSPRGPRVADYVGKLNTWASPSRSSL